jgi:putative membrane protein
MLLLASPSAFGQQSNQQGQMQQEQMQLSEQDRTFAEEAAQGGMAEVELGQLAVQQAESQEVKDFGQRMIDDHGQANQKLEDIAQQMNIELPQELSDEAQQRQQELQLSGAEFDREYMNLMVEDHQKDVDSFEQQTEEGQAPELVTFAEETLPTLQEHLDQAEQIQQQVVGDASQSQDQQQAAAPGPEAETLVGNEVLNDQGDAIGEIEDVVLDAQQNAFAVVSVGGFLGIGDRNVTVPLNELQAGQDDQNLSTTMTKADLENMPEYEESMYSSMFD